MNDIQTWKQGYFVDRPQYRRWTQEQKDNANYEESFNVRPAPAANAICRCSKPSDAEWIAKRLNLASKLEQMTYDFATGKTDGEEITKYVHDCIRGPF